MKLFIRNHSQDFSFFPFQIFSFSFLKMCYHFQNSSLLLKLLSIKLVFSNQKKYTNPEVNNQQSLKTQKIFANTIYQLDVCGAKKCFKCEINYVINFVAS